MKKIKFLSVFTAMLLVLTGCNDYESTDKLASSEASERVTTASETTTSEVQTETQAETEPTEEALFTNCGSSNLVNSGICCTDGENFYYSDTNEKKLYQAENGTATVLADDFYGYYLNMDGDTIYYADAASDNCVTAYSLTSGKRTAVRNMHVQELTLYQDKLYFSCIDGDRKTIYRMNTDGSELESLTSCEDLWYMTIYSDIIYYVNYENDRYSIMSMNLDGSDLKVIHRYNASDLCIAEDRIFFAERDTRYLYSMNLDGSDVQQLNATYSRCVNYMNGQLYYYSSEESGRTVYSCDTNGNITGRYADGAKFLMLMDKELYYYDWEEKLHILSLDKKSDEENYEYGTNITSYQQEEVLRPVRRYLESGWNGYTLDESHIEKNNNIWTLYLSSNGSDKKYQLIIDLTTGKITILCINEDILPVSVYLFDVASVQLSEEEMHRIANAWGGEHYGDNMCVVTGKLEYHDYDKNGTYEAFAVCGGYMSAGGVEDLGKERLNQVIATLFISSTGKITVFDEYYYDGNKYDEVKIDLGKYGEDFPDYYIEYNGKGFFLPRLCLSEKYKSIVSADEFEYFDMLEFYDTFGVFDAMFGVKNDKPIQFEIPSHVWKDEDGDLCYRGATANCYFCSDVKHKHVLIYDEQNDKFNEDVIYP